MRCVLRDIHLVRVCMKVNHLDNRSLPSLPYLPRITKKNQEKNIILKLHKWRSTSAMYEKT